MFLVRCIFSYFSQEVCKMDWKRWFASKPSILIFHGFSLQQWPSIWLMEVDITLSKALRPEPWWILSPCCSSTTWLMGALPTLLQLLYFTDKNTWASQYHHHFRRSTLHLSLLALYDILNVHCKTQLNWIKWECKWLCQSTNDYRLLAGVAKRHSTICLGVKGLTVMVMLVESYWLLRHTGHQYIQWPKR